MGNSCRRGRGGGEGNSWEKGEGEGEGITSYSTVLPPSGKHHHNSGLNKETQDLKHAVLPFYLLFYSFKLRVMYIFYVEGSAVCENIFYKRDDTDVF